MKKRFLSILMALSLALSLLPTAAFAEEGDVTDTGDTGATATSGPVQDADGTFYESITAAVNAGQTNLQLTSDISLNHDSWPDDSFALDLKGHTITMTLGTSKRAVHVPEGKSFELTNGTIVANNQENGAHSVFAPDADATLVLDEITMTTNGAALYPAGNAAAIEVRNSSITAGTYAIGTNASTKDGDLIYSYNVEITLKNSTFTTTGHLGNDKDDCTILLNVPGKLNIDNCTITGHRVGVLVRGGEATIQNSTINLSEIFNGTDADDYDETWGSGNAVPMAALVVGNQSAGAYNYSAKCTLINTTVNALEGPRGAYVYGIDTADRSATLTVEGDNGKINVKPGVDSIMTGGQGQAVVTGGTFSSDVSAYVDDGYKCRVDTSGTAVVYRVSAIENGTLVVDGSVDGSGNVTGSLDGSFTTGGTVENPSTGSGVVDEGSVVDVNDVTVNLQTTGETNATTTTLNVTQATAKSLEDANSLTVQTDAGNVSFNDKALDKISGAQSTVTIQVQKGTVTGQKDVLDSYTVTAADTSGNLLPYGGDENVTVTVTVDKPTNYNAETTQAWYVTGDSSNLTYVEDLDYVETADGRLAIEIGHLSTIVLTNTTPSNTAVARVTESNGTVKDYTDLQTAINEAGENATVRLLRSVELDATGTDKNHGVINISGDKTITLDGNRFTLTAKANFAATGGETWDKDLGQYHVINIENGANVTIQDLIIDGDWAGTAETAEGYNAARTGINIWNTASTSEVKLENVQVNNCSAYAVVAKGADLTINGLTTTGNRWGLDVEDGSTVTIQTANIAEDVVYESSSADSSLTIHNGTYGTVKVQQQDANKTQGTVSINGGTVATVTTGGDQIASATANVTVTGATVGTVNNTSAGTMSIIDSKITGTAPTAESNVIMLNCTNGSNVKLPDIVPAGTKPFLVNSVGYNTLSEALGAISGTGTIVLTKDTEERSANFIITDKSVTITGTGTLTVIPATGETTKAFDLRDGGNLTLDGNVNVTIHGTPNADTSKGNDGTAFAMYTTSTLTIQGNAALNMENLESGMVFPGSTTPVQGAVTVDGATLTASNIDGNFSNGGQFTFKNGATGTITGCGSHGLSANTVTVDTNSKLTVSDCDLRGISINDAGGKLEIRSGGVVNVTNAGTAGTHDAVYLSNNATGGLQVVEGGTLNVTAGASGNNNIMLTDAAATDSTMEGTIIGNVILPADSSKHIITYTSNGSTLSMVVVENSVTLLPAPAAPSAYHTFQSWRGSNGQIYSAGATVNNITSDMTFDAQWSYNPPSTDNGGSGGSSEPSYSPVIDITGNGTIKVSPRTPSEGDEVTITPDPDNGYEVDSVTVTDRSGRTVRVTENRDGTYTFTQPAGRVTIEVTFVRTGENTFFTDVPETFWAYDEIAWAYENGYVNGVTATTFNPNGAISRQQVWMILARLSGYDPADMAAARAWAMENGVSDGTNPGNAVTRQQLVALLFRFAELRNYANDQRADLSVYPDAGTVAEYAVEPMQWSVANDIVGGTTAGTLNPEGTATRAQFAVILYRFWTNV